MDNKQNWLQSILSSWPQIRQVRDLSIISLDNDYSLVVACDSAGAVGNKELDELKVSNYILGRFTARVALLEVVAAGAIPLLISDTLGVEMEPSGREIIQGIKDELKLLGLEEKVHITGSTEENFQPRQTGIGITVVGLVKTHQLKVGKAQAGLEILCFGYPKVGGEVHLEDPELVNVATALDLLAYEGVKEMVPVGSKGILYEAQLLAGSSGCRLVLDPECPLPLKKTAGPATCLLAAVEPPLVSLLQDKFTVPVTKVGRFES